MKFAIKAIWHYPPHLRQSIKIWQS